MTCAPTYRPMPRVGAGARRRCAGLPSGGHGPARDRPVRDVGRDHRGRAQPARVLRTVLRRSPLGLRRAARTLAHAPCVRVERRADPPSALVRLTRLGRAKGRAAGSCSTASSTSATCGSTAPISARPRATSSRTRWTSPITSPRGTSTCWRSRSRAPGRAIAPPSETSPACSSTGTASTPIGTPAASGDRSGSSARAPSG